MKCLLAGSWVALAVACGGSIEGENQKKDPPTCSTCPPPKPTSKPPPDPPYYELCGFTGKVNDGEPCPADSKGDSCESLSQPMCQEPLPKVECTCNGKVFVCGLFPKCPPTTIDAGSPD